MRSAKPILLVEDDREDAMTVSPAIKDLKVTNQLVLTINGEEALEYLKSESNKKPCVILLDLKMPKIIFSRLTWHKCLWVKELWGRVLHVCVKGKFT